MWYNHYEITLTVDKLQFKKEYESDLVSTQSGFLNGIKGGKSQ